MRVFSLLLIALCVLSVGVSSQSTVDSAVSTSFLSAPDGGGYKNKAQAPLIENNIDIKELTINIGKIDVDVDINGKNKRNYSPIITRTGAEFTGHGDEEETVPALYEEESYAAEPDTAEETVLGEADGVTISGSHSDSGSGLESLLSGPQIFSVTFKIQRPKVITMAGASYDSSKSLSAVDFLIRGRGFQVGGDEFADITESLSSQKGASILEPRVFLGAIPLKVVKFDNTLIVARFEDRDDLKKFQPGTYVVRVKVLRVEREENRKGHDIGVLGGQDNGPLSGLRLGGLALPALGAIGGSFPLGSIGSGLGGGSDKGNTGTSLASLFNGFEFDVAVLTTTFSSKDAQKIREAGAPIKELAPAKKP